jgi:type II secretory pathway component PulJ
MNALQKTRQAGFTIVELAVALSVTSIIVLVIMDFMMNNLVQSTLETAQAQLLGEAQTTLDIMGNDVRLSATADQNNRWPDNYAPGAPSNLYSWQSDNSHIVLATAALDKSNNVIFSDPLKYISEKNNIIYFVQDGTLYKRTLAAPVANNRAVTSCPAADASSTCPADKELLHNVSSFTVTYYDGNNTSVSSTDARSVEIAINLQKRQYGHNISASYTTRMVFRND